MLVGGPLGIAVFSVLGGALLVAGLPIYYRWTQANADFRRSDTLEKAVLVVPLGVLGLVLALHVVRPLASLWRRTAETLLTADARDRDATAASLPNPRTLRLHALATAVVAAALVVIWLPIGG